jgi:hypothetical protein
MTGRRHRQTDWLPLLETAAILHEDGRVLVDLTAPDREALLLAFPSGTADPLDRARALLDNLWELDDRAFAFLAAQQGWPYGDDAVLWLVLCDADSLRLCYQQYGVNDEQVIGFTLVGERWDLSGHDPRFRGFKAQ